MPVALALPGWLADNKYNDITSNRNLPFQRAMITDLTPFDWMKQHPEYMMALGHTMAIQREAHWVDSYPITAAIGEYEAAADNALLVDIGGGFGQQALAFKNKIADTKGRIVVQDVRATLNSAPKVEGLEFQEHDFFKEQPIKDAKFYYLSHILHDWTDEDSIQILNAVVPALGPDSRVVIDEIVMPDEQLPWQAAYSTWT
jgi:demethylsterigmatocystin 6-O-methyltransferase